MAFNLCSAPGFARLKKKKAILNKWISSFVTFLCGQCDVCVRVTSLLNLFSYSSVAFFPLSEHVSGP